MNVAEVSNPSILHFIVDVDENPTPFKNIGVDISERALLGEMDLSENEPPVEQREIEPVSQQVWQLQATASQSEQQAQRK